MTEPWGELVRRDHVLVAGMPGCGKTPFAVGLIEPARRAAYVDPAGELDALGVVVPCDYIADAVDPKTWEPTDAAPGYAAELLAGTFCRVVFQPRPGQYAHDFAAVFALCRAAGPRQLDLAPGLVLFGDEVGDLTRAGCEPLLNELHANGHKDGVASVLASPCMTDFPKRCRDTASRVFSFYQKNAADRRALADEYGDDFATAAATWRHPNPPAAWTNPTLHS